MKSVDFNPHGYVASFGKLSVGEIVEAVMVDGRDEVIRAFVAHGVQSIVDENRAKQRRLVKLPLPVPAAATVAPSKGRAVMQLSKTAIKKIKRTMTGALLEWQVHGVSLGYVTKEELLAEAESDERKGNGLFSNVKFYRALAQKMQPMQKVSDAWTAQQVENLKASIWTTEEAEVA